jgi:hypothetical protein
MVGVLIGGALAALLLLTCTVSLSFWYFTSGREPGNAKNLTPGTDAPTTTADNKPADPQPDTPGEDILVQVSKQEADDIHANLQKEVKHLLSRKTPPKAGGDGGWEPVAPVNLNPANPELQKINAAIDKGVAYLKRTQKADGTWHNGHPVGYASIGGLTLLECGIPADDPCVQRAAAYVRSHVANLTKTYELSLAILFLDRLGDLRDRPIIQVLALRIMAGQSDGGGWTYNCSVLTPQDNIQLYHFLHTNKRPELLNPLDGGTKTPSGIVNNPVREPNNLADPFKQFQDLVLDMAIAAPPKKGKGKQGKTPVIPPLGPDTKGTKDAKPASAPPVRPDMLKPNLQRLPVVKYQGKLKNQVPRPTHDTTDNSNTQFAMLALWAARRHDVPTDHALLAAYQRFMASQVDDGGWGYHFAKQRSTASMTCVGLLGLAMGHGAAPDFVKAGADPKNLVFKPALEDRDIQRGLQALARNIGDSGATAPMQNLYFMWSVERVAMLYDLKTIGGKDWYGWGSQILVRHQRPEGDWHPSQYHGASPPLNTCFALLFLRRSNLVQDLTNNLRLQSAIRERD